MKPYLQDADFTLWNGDVREVLRELPAESVHCVVTSPPYWALRDYGAEGQLGLESTPDEYVANMVEVFREVRRVMRSDATLWCNMGDSFADKQLQMIPARLALALQADGWYLRSQIVWSKPNPMPESVTDRPTTSHEFVYLLAKSPRYFFDQEAVSDVAINAGKMVSLGDKSLARRQLAGTGIEPWGNAAKDAIEVAPRRNLRSVWEIATQPYPEAHFATYPEELVRRCILAGSPEGGLVLDPFMGSGTTALVARKHGRRSIGIELNESYCRLAAERLSQLSLLSEVS